MNRNQAITLAVTLQDKIDDLKKGLLTFRQKHNIALEDLKAYRRKHFSG